VANGLAFGEDGTLFVADTARSGQGCPDAGPLLTVRHDLRPGFSAD
jgi:sugar lactone lactonase YvrE